MRKGFIFFTIFILAISAFVFIGCGNSTNARSRAARNLSNITIDAELIDQQVKVSQTTNFINSSENTINELLFKIYANAYKEGVSVVPQVYEQSAFPNGKSYGHAEFHSVTVGGQKADFKIDTIFLTVPLASSLYPRERINVEKGFVVHLANIRHRLGYADGVYNLAHFYAVPAALRRDGSFIKNEYHQFGDPFSFESANFEVTFIASQNFVFANSGKITRTERRDNGRVASFITAQAARDFAIIGSSEFQVLRQGKFSFFYLKHQNPQEILNLTIEAYEFFEKKFGKSYLDALSVVEAPLVFGGMEYSGIALVSLDALTRPEKYKEIVVHEIAHQWWFGLVGNCQFSESWLDEALTEFSTMLFFARGDAQKLRVSVALKLDNLRAFVDAIRVGGEVNLRIDRALNEFSTANEYAHIVYYQGAIMFYCIMEIVGEKAFFAALRRYVRENKFQIATRADLIGAFQRETFKGIDGVFEQWLSGNINLGEI